MNKKKYIWIILLLLIIFLGISKLLDINKQSPDTKENTIIKASNISERSLEAEETIINSIKYRNEKNLEKVLENYTDINQKNNFRLDNLEKIELDEIVLVTDEEQYRNYIISSLLNDRNLDVEQVKIYKVTYDITYKDETIEPSGNGKKFKHYYVVNEKGSDKWLINGVGD